MPSWPSNGSLGFVVAIFSLWLREWRRSFRAGGGMPTGVLDRLSLRIREARSSARHFFLPCLGVQ